MTSDTVATAEIESTISALEDARYAAVLAGDADSFAALAHPELLYTHSNAVVDTLDSYLENLRTGFYVYHRIDHPVHRIVVVGDTVLVSGEMRADITAGGVRKQLANSALAVWVRDNNQWLLLGYGPTVIPGTIR
ncbi:nuclear transport factor 2 family protein [Nocardia sp. NPDC050378]|uniref:nuclear transport factor 2 family protein n=1 Tax=Nocardia sp. NPDC050378 TaxID=3155400 RepID=UPI0033C158E0